MPVGSVGRLFARRCAPVKMRETDNVVALTSTLALMGMVSWGERTSRSGRLSLARARSLKRKLSFTGEERSSPPALATTPSARHGGGIRWWARACAFFSCPWRAAHPTAVGAARSRMALSQLQFAASETPAGRHVIEVYPGGQIFGMIYAWIPRT